MAAMASAEDLKDGQGGFSTAKKRRVQRACDSCRRKKIRCDGIERTDQKCSNCSISHVECTYEDATKKRGPSKRVAESLDSRLNRMEQLLNKMAAGDTSEDETSSGNVSVATTSRPRESLDHESPLDGTLVEPCCGPPPIGEGCFLDPDMSDMCSGDYFVNGLTAHMKSLSLQPVVPRYIGESSGFRLLNSTLGLKFGHAIAKNPALRPWGRMRTEFWSACPWEEHNKAGPCPSSQAFEFPPADLMESLINLYFRYINDFVPLLHEPSFKKKVAGDTHIREDAFACLLLLVCACGSRWSDDKRVLIDGYDGWHSAGWRYFNQLRPRVACRSLFAPPCLYELQSHTLVTVFLSSSSVPESGWLVIGVGIRAAQDIGVHRLRGCRSPALLVEDEQWRRAFWTLVSFDRYYSATLGRSFAINEEAFDLDMPIECDDEYWLDSNSNPVMKQPEDRPSKLAYFIWSIKLDRILAFAHQTIYSIHKSKLMMGFVGDEWEKRIVAQLDSALNEWRDSLPSHLHWDPHREDCLFFLQSAYLYCAYYRLQIIVHRPFIPQPGKTSNLPSLTICTNAARALIRILDTVHQRDNCHFPHFLFTESGLFSACIVLLFNVWAGTRSGLCSDPSKEMDEVKKGLRVLEQSEPRWYLAGRLRDILCSLVEAGDLYSNPRSMPVNKRQREHEETEDRGMPGRSTDANFGSGTDDASHSILQQPQYADPSTSTFDASSLPTPADVAGLPVFSHETGNLALSTDYDIYNAFLWGSQTSPNIGRAFQPDGASLQATTPLDLLSSSASLSQVQPPVHSAQSPNDRGFMGPSQGMLPSGMQSTQADVGSDHPGPQANIFWDDHLSNLWLNAPSGFSFDEWGNFITNVGEDPGQFGLGSAGLDDSEPFQ